MDKVERVSVCMITYNHERYISKAIEGVLNQIIEFELVIVDDASTDNTSSLINQYIQNHPKGKCINYIRNSENKGMINNFIFALKQCKYDKIALCEGDDYWDDPEKLMIQNQILNENPKIVGVFHDVKIITKKGLKDSFLKNISKKSFENESLISVESVIEQKWIIPTCSLIFRKSALLFPDIFYKMRHGDYPLFCMLGISGPFLFLEKPMGVYRMDNEQSVVNSMKPLETITIHTNYIEFLLWLNVFTDFKYEKSIRTRIINESNGIDYLVRSFQKGKIYQFYQIFVVPFIKIRRKL